MSSILACDEESAEPEVITGDIKGRVGYYLASEISQVDSLADVLVTLHSEKSADRTFTTSSDGLFHFDEVEAGKYYLTLVRDDGKFKDTYGQPSRPITHLGGATTRVNNLKLLEVPQFSTTVVGHEWEPNYGAARIKVRVSKTIGRFYFNFYLSNTSSVSRVNFIQLAQSAYFGNAPDIVETTEATELEYYVFMNRTDMEYVIVYPTSVWSLEVEGTPSQVYHLTR